MKKSLLFILASLIAIFALTGCADEPAKEEGNKPLPDKVTPINLKDPKTLVGTYDVKFFGTVALNQNTPYSAVSTDCAKFSEMPLGLKFKVEPSDNADMALGNKCANKTRLIGGKVTIRIDENKNSLAIESKLQMAGPFFSGTLGSAGKTDTYQFTKYSEVLLTNINEQGVNFNNQHVGVSGRNLTSKTDNPKSTFKVTALDATSIFIDMELKGKQVIGMNLDAPTNVKAVKVSDTVEKLDPNSLFVTADQLTDQKEKDIFNGFVKEPK